MLASGVLRPSWRLRTLFLLFLAAPFLFSSELVRGAPDTSRPRVPEREWRDEFGNVIKKLDRDGRLTLFTWDLKGRVVRIDGFARRFALKEAEGPLERSPTWTHCFERSEDGVVTREIDCSGRAHTFSAEERANVDLRRGTALAEHKHPRSTERTEGGIEKP